MEPIAVRRYGLETAPPVVLVHGGPGAIGSMRPLAELLAGEWRVLEPLQRRGGDPPVTVESHVADLAEALPGPVPLVGHSWGAMLALSFAVDHPDLVTSLVLVGCGTYSSDGHGAYRRIMRERLGPEGLARMEEMKAAEERAAADEERDRIFTERGDYAAQVQAFDPRPEATDLPGDPVGHRQTWEDAMRRQEDGIEPASFAAITAPVTMIHGAADPHVGPIIRATLAAHMPQLRYEELPRCGHTPWIERAAAAPFLRLLGEVLR